jgi:hypothetical protein
MLSGRMSGTEIRVSEMLKGHICTELDRNLEKRFQGVKAVLRSTYVEREMLASGETEPWEKKALCARDKLPEACHKRSAKHNPSQSDLCR